MRMAAQINKRFESSVLADYFDTDITCLQLKKLIQAEIRPFYANIRIVRDIVPTEKKQFMISGMYDPNKTSRNITIYLHFSKPRKFIHLSKAILNKLIFLVIQTLQHELVHRSSTRWMTYRIKVKYSNALGKKERDNIKYLTDRDEIDAYAH